MRIPTPHRENEPTRSDAIVGQWPRKRLLAMDRRFRERVERAIASERATQGDAGSRRKESPREALIAHLRNRRRS